MSVYIAKSEQLEYLLIDPAKRTMSVKLMKMRSMLSGCSQLITLRYLYVKGGMRYNALTPGTICFLGC